MIRFYSGRYDLEVTRRAFLAGAAVAASGGPVVLEAIYGARLPAKLRIGRRLASNHRYFELRTYTGKGDLTGVLARAGMRPHPMGDMRFLIPFDSMEQRSQAWVRLNADPEWARMRSRVRLCEITIFCQPGGRIFEISL